MNKNGMFVAFSLLAISLPAAAGLLLKKINSPHCPTSYQELQEDVSWKILNSSTPRISIADMPADSTLHRRYERTGSFLDDKAFITCTFQSPSGDKTFVIQQLEDRNHGGCSNLFIIFPPEQDHWYDWASNSQPSDCYTTKADPAKCPWDVYKLKLSPSWLSPFDNDPSQ